MKGQPTETIHKLIRSNMELPDFLLHRDPETSKVDYGHAFLIAGAYGRMGCAILAAKACLRSGAGLITCYLPEPCVDAMQIALPEAMVSICPYEESDNTFPKDLNRFAAIGIGPGIGTSDEAYSTMNLLLMEMSDKTPLVIDADAINLLAYNGELLNYLPKNVILTPHEREFDRLWGKKFSSREERLAALPQLADEIGATIVLKGHTTAIASPKHPISFITTGNAGMATAGSGDVLTGIILGLLSQNAMISSNKRLPLHQIAEIGVQIHGKSGEIAAQKQAECTIIASDLIKNLRYAIN